MKVSLGIYNYINYLKKSTRVTGISLCEENRKAISREHAIEFGCNPNSRDVLFLLQKIDSGEEIELEV